MIIYYIISAALCLLLQILCLYRHPNTGIDVQNTTHPSSNIFQYQQNKMNEEIGERRYEEKFAG